MGPVLDVIFESFLCQRHKRASDRRSIASAFLTPIMLAMEMTLIGPGS
jgi:hypothetical protein